MKNFWGAFVLLSAELAASPVPILLDSFSVGDMTGSSSAAGTTIFLTNNSTLNFQDQSTAGDAFISIDSTSVLNFQQTTASTYSGLLTGSGNVNKTGSGDLTMTGNNAPFTGPLFVQTGTLFLDGNYGGNVTVAPSARIVYGGAISGNLIVDNSTITTNGIRTLSVGGNYTQTSSGIYLVQVNSAGQSTLIDIAGMATISGFVEVDTSAGVQFNHRYTILQAAGGVTGTYSFLGPNPFGFLLSYDPMHVYLSISGNDFTVFGKTPNQKKVATQIDSITSANANELEVIGALMTLDPAQTENALDQMSGEQYSNFILTTMYADSRFGQKIYDAYREFINPCVTHCVGPDIWLSAGSGKGFQGGNASTPGFSLSNYDITSGVHSCLGEEWLLGGAVGYEVDFIHSKLPGTATLRTGQLALYSAFQSKHVYVLTDLIGARSWSSYKRPIDFSTLDRTAKSKPRLSHGRLDLEIGTDIGGCHFRVQPFVSGSAEGYHQDKVHEHGAGSINLKIRPITKWLASTEAGAHITFNYFKWTTIALDMGWQHYYGNLRVSEETHFEDFGTLFLIEGPRRGHDGGVGALYVSQKLGSSWEIYGEATGEIWRNWHAYEFNGGVSYKW